MIDILLLCDKEDRDLNMAEISTQFPSIKIKTLFFNEDSTRMSISYETDRIFISQFSIPVDTHARLYIYHPLFHDNQSTSLYSSDQVEESYQSFIYQEWQVVTEYLEFILEKRGKWVNKPSLSRRAKNKITQMMFARKLNLDIPKGIITNDEKAIKQFFDTDSGIYKSISESGVINNDLVLRTSMFTMSEIGKNSGLELTPECFQEFINTDIELRTYVAGDSAITIVIKTQDKLLTPDIRSQPKKNENFEISDEFNAYGRKLVNLVQSMNLKYAAIDSILTDNGIKFLELNPNGSWNWLPQKIQHKVSNFFWTFILKYLHES